MEHPPKQGLKHSIIFCAGLFQLGFNGTSTKTRIETSHPCGCKPELIQVLMEHPPKQGLKPQITQSRFQHRKKVLMEHPPKQGLKQQHLRQTILLSLRF